MKLQTFAASSDGRKIELSKGNKASNLAPPPPEASLDAAAEETMAARPLTAASKHLSHVWLSAEATRRSPAAGTRSWQQSWGRGLSPRQPLMAFIFTATNQIPKSRRFPRQDEDGRLQEDAAPSVKVGVLASSPDGLRAASSTSSSLLATSDLRLP